MKILKLLLGASLLLLLAAAPTYGAQPDCVANPTHPKCDDGSGDPTTPPVLVLVDATGQQIGHIIDLDFRSPISLFEEVYVLEQVVDLLGDTQNAIFRMTRQGVVARDAIYFEDGSCNSTPYGDQDEGSVPFQRGLTTPGFLKHWDVQVLAGLF